jgi:hypothetical protein
MRFDMCPRGHIARRSNKNWQNLLGRREGVFDNLHDGPVTCVGAWVSQHFGNRSEKSSSVEGARTQLPQPRHHRT